jgi:anti-anti-sigma regulatory factor
MTTRQNTLILALGEEYDMLKLGEVVALPKLIQAHTIEHVIVDAHALTWINVMGTEILALKDCLPSNAYSLVFVGLKPETATIFELLDSERQYGELVNFQPLAEALAFLNMLPLAAAVLPLPAEQPKALSAASLRRLRYQAGVILSWLIALIAVVALVWWRVS